MSKYGDLFLNDIVGWLKPLLDAGVYKSRMTDGKFALGELSEPVSPPWHYINFIEGANCVYLHQHLFSSISPRTPIGRFIPRRCHNCWKVVIRPKTLKQLFALENLITQTGWPGKCGIERRSHTPLSKYRYGGYIYNNGHEQGLERLGKMRELLDQIPALNGVECYLKRGCTEFELAFPDSSTWEVTDEQHRIEDLLDWLIISDVPTTMMPKHIVDKVHMVWIEWAAENGDETYKEYTDGQPLFTPCVTYEPRVEGTDEDTPDDETVSVSPSSREVPKGIARKKTKEKKK